jgi:hypothetical protein
MGEEQLVTTMPDGKRLLRLAMIYGANASGKTNVLMALDWLKRYWTFTPQNIDKPTGFIPFRFDPETPKQPTPEELQAQREREVHEQTETQVLDVFARSRNMQASSSTTENNSDEKGDPGSLDGNTTQGSEIGVGGVGPKPQLDGRKVVGVLPVPSNVNIPEAARVVVNIWVDANGKVTKATINSRSTKTMNADLRQRSIEAALKTRFNAIEADPESEDATGTIIYFYEFAN